ncbi:hypothetical protein M434DRAFT_30577 [Hypoxylon sp. CO27-5]|nr:hypothetical protein M434DRAFT_30577 [Hypoxylon sp. CO27-5]
MSNKSGKAHNPRHSEDFPRKRDSNVFNLPAHKHTLAKRYVWTAEETEIIRRHVEANTGLERSLQPLLKSLNLHGYEDIRTDEDLDFKYDILMTKLLQKIKYLKAKDKRKASTEDEEVANPHSASLVQRRIGNAFAHLLDLLEECESIFRVLEECESIFHMLEECESIFRDFGGAVEEPIGGTPSTESKTHRATQDEDSKDDHGIE